jgi:hypothetical protein
MCRKHGLGGIYGVEEKLEGQETLRMQEKCGGGSALEYSGVGSVHELRVQFYEPFHSARMGLKIGAERPGMLLQ